MSIRAPIREPYGQERALEASAMHYLARVLRMREGDAFIAFDPATGRESDATVVHVAHDAMTVRFGQARDASAQATRAIVIVQGLAKGDKCDAIVRDATELGATRVVIVPTARSVVDLDGPRALRRVERWRRVAEEASRQCKRAAAPEVHLAESWSDALAHADNGARFCLYEGATEPLGHDLAAALHGDSPLSFAIGPEGGLDEAEVAIARARGWHIASLGPLTLRTETVAAAVLGAVRVLACDAPIR